MWYNFVSMIFCTKPQNCFSFFHFPINFSSRFFIYSVIFYSYNFEWRTATNLSELELPERKLLVVCNYLRIDLGTNPESRALAWANDEGLTLRLQLPNPFTVKILPSSTFYFYFLYQSSCFISPRILHHNFFTNYSFQALCMNLKIGITFL